MGSRLPVLGNGDHAEADMYTPPCTSAAPEVLIWEESGIEPDLAWKLLLTQI